MEQLIIFLLFVVGSIISSVIQHKKKKAEELQQRELEDLTRRPRHTESAPARKAESSWPQTAGDWQEQLRRMLEGESAPPVIKPVLLPPEQNTPARTSKPSPPPAPTILGEGAVDYKGPLKVSAEHYKRASNLHAHVAERMRGIRQKKTAPVPSAFNRARPKLQSDVVRRLRRSRTAVREAFIASIIFAPPKALESGEIESAR